MTMAAETVFIDTNILVYATDNESPFNAKSLGIYSCGDAGSWGKAVTDA